MFYWQQYNNEHHKHQKWVHDIISPSGFTFYFNEGIYITDKGDKKVL